jgi:hypothetical protein
VEDLDVLNSEAEEVANSAKRGCSCMSQASIVLLASDMPQYHLNNG